MTQEEVAVARDAELRALEESQVAWFREHVSDAPLRIPATVDLSPTQCYCHEDGTFSGGKADGVIYRWESDDDDVRVREFDDITWAEDGLRTTVRVQNRSVVPDTELRDLLRDRFDGGDPGVSTGEPAELWRLSSPEKQELARTRMVGNIASDISPAPVTLELVPNSVPVHDDATGEFSAFGEGFSLNRARRAESLGEIAMNDPASELHRWSTPDFDWGLTVTDLVSIDRAGMETLWEQLHPGVPVDRYSRYRPGA